MATLLSTEPSAEYVFVGGRRGMVVRIRWIEVTLCTWLRMNYFCIGIGV